MDVDVTVRHSLVPQRRIERIACPSRLTMIVSTMVVMSVVVMSVVVMAMIVKAMVVLGGGVRVSQGRRQGEAGGEHGAGRVTAGDDAGGADGGTEAHGPGPSC